MEFNATFLVSTVSFIVFVFIMNAIFYKPLEKVVDERKNFIDNNYKEASDASEKSASLLKDREDKLAKASGDARKKMVDITDNAKNEKAELCENSRQKSNDEIKQKKEELNKASDDAKQTLKNNVASIASSISSKILGENVNIDAVDNEIVDKIMQEG